MAKASWCSVSPASGSGNATVSVSGTAYTGRSARTTTLTFSASGVTSKTVTVNQASPGNVLTASSDHALIPAAGGSTLVTGTCNQQRMGFVCTNSAFTFSNPQISTNGGSTWTNITSGANISGDPGATAAYMWRVTVTCSTPNPGSSTRQNVLRLSTENITQSDVYASQAGNPNPASFNQSAFSNSFW